MKIIINENSLHGIKESLENKLPDFIYKAIKTNNTSLGDCAAFPPNDEMGYAYSLIKERFSQVSNAIEKYGYESYDESFLISRLGKLINSAIKIESGLKNHLEKLCEVYANKVLHTPSDTILLDCKLVKKIETKQTIRILPESTYGNTAYTFDDVEDIEFSNKAVAKRRFVDSLIQGIAYDLTWRNGNWLYDIEKLSSELPSIYLEIKDIENYLLFIKKEKISDKNPLQDSFVEVKLGRGAEKTSIKSQGIIFPYLLRETFRGFLELFSSHGLPNDNEKAMYVIKKADFVLAEPWDMRFGVLLWRKIRSNYDGYTEDLIPYLFAQVCELGSDDFNDAMKNMLAGTVKGKKMFRYLVDNVKNDMEYNEFKDRLASKNASFAMINDEYISTDELDKMNL